MDKTALLVPRFGQHAPPAIAGPAWMKRKGTADMQTYDVAMIGAGHNGLVAACYLQRAGLKVIVLEKNDWVGGAATSRELTPGFLYSNCSYVCSLFRRKSCAIWNCRATACR